MMTRDAGPSEGDASARTGERVRVALLIDTLCGDYEQLLREAVVRETESRGMDLRVLVGGCLEAGTGDAMSAFYRLVGPASADGVIVVSSRLGIHVGMAGVLDFCRALRARNVCSVGLALPGVPSLVVDNGRGMRSVVEHLVAAHGARRIAFIAGPVASAEAADRLSGYREALEDGGVPFREELVAEGAFTASSGRLAMQTLLGGGARLDAVVAANDAMAFGAMDVLRARGMRVPEDVLVAGFDDARASRFTRPSLTTVGQPFGAMGALAIGRVLDGLAGRAAEPLTLLEVTPAIRQSCGCGVLPDDRTERADRPLADAVRSTLEGLNTARRQAATAWGERLVDATTREIAGEGGAFPRELRAILEEVEEFDDALEHLQTLISVLRDHVSRGGRLDPAARLRMDDVWHRARLLVAEAAVRVQGRKHLQAEATSTLLRRSGGRLSTALSLPGIKAVLTEELPALDVGNAAVSLWSGEAGAPPGTSLEAWFALRGGLSIDTEAKARFAAELLVPPEALAGIGATTLVVMPLTFGADRLGILALQSGEHTQSYEMIRDQLSAAIQTVRLHENMVAQTAARERLEREHLEEESKIAQRIQSAILPTDERIEGLEISAAMLPAAQVGGDYYDIIPAPGGGWLGIGDVTGHGLASGLIMLMMQSAIAAIVTSDPAMSPSEVLAVANRVMVTNTRRRMKVDDHMTIALLRYERDGTVTYAGAHEDILVHRARSRTCERIETRGTWLGVRPDIRSSLGDRSFRLEDGDVLLVYSDGITEARSAHGEFFGLDRLCELLTSLCDQPPEAIQKRVMQSVARWTSRIDDDLALLVARYRAA